MMSQKRLHSASICNTVAACRKTAAVLAVMRRASAQSPASTVSRMAGKTASS